MVFSLEPLKFAVAKKGSPDPSHFIFEIIAGKRRIRHRTTLNLNDFILNRFWVDLEFHHSISKSLHETYSLSDPTLSDIDLIKWLGSEPDMGKTNNGPL